MATKKRALKKNADAAKKATAPWERSPPAKSTHRHLSAAQKQKAKTAAQKAGRSYPNLIDNMRAAKSSRKPHRDPR